MWQKCHTPSRLVNLNFNLSSWLSTCHGRVSFYSHVMSPYTCTLYVHDLIQYIYWSPYVLLLVVSICPRPTGPNPLKGWVTKCEVSILVSCCFHVKFKTKSVCVVHLATVHHKGDYKILHPSDYFVALLRMTFHPCLLTLSKYAHIVTRMCFVVSLLCTSTFLA